MKKIKIASFIAMALMGCSSVYARLTNTKNVQRPKLVVGIVVDQMRWDYLYRYQKRYGEGGFKRLLGKGISKYWRHREERDELSGVLQSRCYQGAEYGF